jgi:hypothetical protein
MRLLPRDGARIGRTGSRSPAAREDVWDALHREVDRSRRHGHTLALLRLVPTPAGPATTAAILGRLRATVRSVDSAWADGGDIVLLLPECDRAAAERLVARLRAALPGALGRVRVGCFPADGLTAAALRQSVAGAPTGPGRLVDAGVRE